VRRSGEIRPLCCPGDIATSASNPRRTAAACNQTAIPVVMSVD